MTMPEQKLSFFASCLDDSRCSDLEARCFFSGELPSSGLDVRLTEIRKKPFCLVRMGF